MRELDDCWKYEPDIKRVTVSNSFIADGRVIYIVKKEHTGKSIKLFVAYDKATKVQLAAHWDKEVLISYIQKQDMSVFPRDEASLF